MLVKLGDIWVDPARIEFLEPSQEYDVVAVITTDRASQAKGDIDSFAAIVNDALAPKQSWSEEVSEPEK